MRLYYLKNGKKCVAEYTNKDVSIAIKINNNRYQVEIEAHQDITLLKADYFIPFNVNYKDTYFLNGYQSWTDTKEFRLQKTLRDIRKAPHLISYIYAMREYGDSRFYKYSIRRMHGYDIFYSKGNYESFIYNMNYKNAYLLIELTKGKKDIRLISDVKNINLRRNEKFLVFDFNLYYDFEQGLKSFNDTFPLKNVEKIFGYTSWYNYYQKINEGIIIRDLNALDNRFNLFQIDDGYETFVGDWLDIDKNKFPNGLKPIVDRIHAKGFKAGLWLAPFVAEKKSKLFQEHQDWFKKYKNGKPVRAGGNWSGQYSLDLDNPEVIEYITKCLNYYVDMGFDFFKLDFLYAAALPEYEGRTRCQVQDQAYKLLRDILKDKLILGCGAHIMNSYGYFDYLRVGPDVSLSFDDIFYMRLFHRERPSTKVTLQNTIFRSFMNERLFANDPDVFLLRDDNIKLSLEQRVALTTINALFGHVLMTSDNISTYDETKKEILKHTLDLFYKSERKSYSIRGHIITIKYFLNNVEHKIQYNVNKGTFINRVR